MKATTLFQLGGIAVFLSAILTGIGSAIYFASGESFQPTTLHTWRGIFAGAFFVLGFGTLFARQAQRGGILGLIGYAFIMLAQMYFIGSDAVTLGVAAGVISQEQIVQVRSYALLDSILPWIWVAGLITFGISIYRAQVLPKYAGALLILLGLIQPFTGVLAFTRPVYAICYFVAWTWLGWALLTDKSVVSREPVPAA